MYKFDQRAQTRTSFATVDKKEMIKRKDVKKTKLEKAIADLDKEILAEKKQIQKVQECLECPWMQHVLCPSCVRVCLRPRLCNRSPLDLV